MPFSQDITNCSCSPTHAMGHRLGCFQGAERYLEVLPLKGDMAKESGKKHCTQEQEAAERE